MIRATTAILILAAMAATAAAETKTVIVQTAGAKVVAVLEVTGSASGAVTVTPKAFQVVIGNQTAPNPTPTDPPAPGTLASWVEQSIKEVPDHPNKEAGAVGVGAIYAEIAKQVENGAFGTGAAFDVNRMFSAIADATDQLTRVLGSEAEWKAWRSKLNAELTRRQLNQDQLPDALREISQGATGGKAIIADLAPIIFELIQAVIAQDRDAIKTAVLKAIPILIRGIIAGQ